MKTTVRAEEIRHFQKDSSAWHAADGPFAPLHAINPLRISFIRDVLVAQNAPLKGAKVLDVGCGGGLLCEPMTRLGARVTGLDADPQAIVTAKDHAARLGLDITYTAAAIEDFRKSNPRAVFDIITAMEIIEHVAETDLFLGHVAAALRPGGLLFMSTLNRTVQSYALGIVAAEHILGLVPPGTHRWSQFVKPSELARALRPHGLFPIAMTGVGYHLLRDEFYLAPKDTRVNYMMAFCKAE